MFFPGGRKDDNIVEVKEARLSMEAGQDSIHEAGKGGRRVAETKGNLVELKQLPAASSKLAISTLQVQSRESFCPMESIQEVVNPG